MFLKMNITIFILKFAIELYSLHLQNKMDSIIRKTGLGIAVLSAIAQ
jgi:hypothetical protein